MNQDESNTKLVKTATAVEYRVIKGDNFEGLSIRQVFLDKKRVRS